MKKRKAGLKEKGGIYNAIGERLTGRILGGKEEKKKD